MIQELMRLFYLARLASPYAPDDAPDCLLTNAENIGARWTVKDLWMRLEGLGIDPGMTQLDAMDVLREALADMDRED